MYSAHFDIPNIPGYRRDYAEQDRYRKAQRRASRQGGLPGRGAGLGDTSLNVTGRSVISEADAPPPGGSFDNAMPSPPCRSRPASAASSPRTRAQRRYKLSDEQPSWLTKESRVLRFKVFMEEPVSGYAYDGSEKVSMRIRKLVLEFHLADQTVAMHETKIANSGLPQGRFLRRTRLQRPDGQMYTPRDLQIGFNFELNGRVFTVVDASTSTRAYFRDELSIALPPALPYPDDGFARERAMREPNSIKLAQSRKAGKGAKSKKKKKGAGSDSDHTVLRFFCACDDPPPSLKGPGNLTAAELEAAPEEDETGGWEDPMGECNRPRLPSASGGGRGTGGPSMPGARSEAGHLLFTLHYFVADDTVEVKTNPQDGVRTFPYLLRRRQLPFDSTIVPDGVKIGHELGEDPEAPAPDESADHGPVRMVRWEDLRCGNVLVVYNHPLLLLSCDETTRRWYHDRGIAQKPLKVVPEDDTANAPRVPPYNGFGDEADLYAMGLSLQPAIAANKQDEYSKFMSCHDKVMRFRGHLVDMYSGQADPGAREMVINYYLADDTIQVYEPEVRNSGSRGGVFLLRMRYKKHITPRILSDSADSRPRFSIQQRRGLPLSQRQQQQQQFGEPAGKHTGVKRTGGLLSRWFRPTDFVPGSDITFEMPSTGCPLHRFRIVDYDDYTRQLVEDGLHGGGLLGDGNSTAGGAAHGGGEAALEAADGRATGEMALLLSKIAEFCAVHTVPLRSSFVERDTSGRGRLEDEPFKRAMRALRDSDGQPLFPSSALSADELDQLCWEFAAEAHDGDVLVDYQDFVDAVVLACPEPTVASLFHKSGNSAAALQESMLRNLRAHFAKGKPLGGRLRRTFREFDRRDSNIVTSEEWFQVLRKHRFHSIMSKSKAEALRKEFEAYDPNRPDDFTLLDYHALCDAVFPGDFDQYVNRLLVVLRDQHGRKFGPDPDEAKDPGSSRRPSVGSFASAAGTTNGAGVGKPTMRNYLDELTHKRTHAADDETKLSRAMRSFSVSFGRTHRKGLLRKNLISYDVSSSGLLGKREFLGAIEKSVNEGFIELDVAHFRFLADFFFPQPDVNKLNYDELINVICARDVPLARQLREEAQDQQFTASSEFR